MIKNKKTKIVIQACTILFATMSVALYIVGCSSALVFRVATNAFFAPFEYFEKGEYKGIDIDIANIIAQRLDMRLEISDMEFDSVLASVVSGNTDIGMAGLTATPTREKVVDFTIPYFDSGQTIITSFVDKSFDELESIEDSEERYRSTIEILSQKRIGVIGGFVGESFVDGDQDWGFDGIPDATKVVYNNSSLAVISLQNSQIDCIILDTIVSERLVKNNIDKIKLVNIQLTEEKNVFVIQKGNKKLKEQVDQIIEDLMNSSQLDEIIDKYF